MRTNVGVRATDHGSALTLAHGCLTERPGGSPSTRSRMHPSPSWFTRYERPSAAAKVIWANQKRKSMSTGLLVPLDPRVWGRSYWTAMHVSGFHYPEQPSLEQQQGAENWLLGIAWMLPCPRCREHFSSLLENCTLASVVKNRESLSRFLLRAHNDVNTRNGKEVWSYGRAFDYYTRKDDDKTQACPRPSTVNFAGIDRESGIALGVAILAVFSLTAVFWQRRRRSASTGRLVKVPPAAQKRSGGRSAVQRKR